MTNGEQDEVGLAKNKIEQKLGEYGSVELMANLATIEMLIQSPTFHNSASTLAEEPFMAYTLGLFLSNNNIGAGEPHPNQIEEFSSLLIDYLEKFKISLMDLENQKPTRKDFVAFESKLQKILDDANPHAYMHQKDEYYQNVFSPLNNHFVSKYGFSVDYVRNFTDNFICKVEKYFDERLELVKKKRKEAETQLQQPQSKILLEKHKKKNLTPEYVLAYYTKFLIHMGSKHILTINLDEYYNEQTIKDKEIFKKFLNEFSCSFGDQFDEFDDMLSDNIIFYKPIIKLNENTFFVPKSDFLRDKLDLALEYLLEEEKKEKTSIWDEFANLKSKYVEDKAFEFISRIFPSRCIFRNAYYWSEGERKEVDLLVIYDNKIFIIESKSGSLPLEAKRDGRKKLMERLETLVKKASQQCMNTEDYIKSHPKATFWTDKTQEKILVEIDSTTTNFEFFFVNVTLEYLGSIGTNLKDLEPFNFFEDDKYPWAVYLHDLDIITNLLSEPIYFIHYAQQRIAAQKRNVLHSHSDLIFLSYYLIHGSLVSERIMDSTNLAMMSLLPGIMNPIENYYQLNEEKPRLIIPKKLEELLLNMQKYHQQGFTDITSLLLDFPQHKKKKISRLLDKTFNKTVKKGIPDGFIVTLTNSSNIGFLYHTTNNMNGFYKICENTYKQKKSELKIERGAIMGRNVCDKKNYATFFIYDDSKHQS